MMCGFPGYEKSFSSMMLRLFYYFPPLDFFFSKSIYEHIIYYLSIIVNYCLYLPIAITNWQTHELIKELLTFI